MQKRRIERLLLDAPSNLGLRPFIDGHTDYPFPRHPQRYEKDGFTAAGLDLGLATGHGSPELSDIDGLAPYFREEDVVVLAYRDAGTPDNYILDAWERSPMTRLPLERVRDIGVAASIQEALLQLERPELEGFWIHLDVDVLDPQWMPAVDSPDPGGLRFDELEPIVRAAVQSPRAVGMELTIFDPDKDPDGRLARQLVDLLARAFAPAPGGTSGHVPRRAGAQAGRAA